MSVSLDRESRWSWLGRWGMESGGLRATSILGFSLVTTALASSLALWTGVRIDTVALGVTFCSLELRLERGLLLALGIAYLGESFTGTPHGLYLFGAAASYGLLRLLVFRVVGARAATVAGLAGLASGAAAMARMGLAASVGAAHPAPASILATLLATAVVAYPVFCGYRFVSDRFRAREDTLFR